MDCGRVGASRTGLHLEVRKLNFFRSLCTYVNIFRYSSKKIRSGGGPAACLGISGGGLREDQ